MADAVIPRQGGGRARLLPTFLVTAVLVLSLATVVPSSDMSADLEEGGDIGDDVHYTFDSATGTVTISGSGGTYDYEITSGEGHNNFSPFYQNTDIRAVVIEEGVTSIGDELFCRCSSLVSVEFPSTLTSIGGDTFSDCSSLVHVDLSSTRVETIGEEYEGNTFTNCSSLESIELPSTLKYLGPYTFSSCSKLTEVDLSNTQVETFEHGCLDSCTSLTTVKLPATLMDMGKNVFSGCVNLETVTFYGDQAPDLESDALQSRTDDVAITIYTTGWGSEDLFKSPCGSTNYVLGTTSVHTLSYDLNGGSGSIESQYGDYRDDGTQSTTRLSSSIPTRAGYTFLGWSEDPDATSADYLAGGAYAFPGPYDVTLYAVWDDGSVGSGTSSGSGSTEPVHSFTIYYDANGGTGAPDAQRYTTSSSSATMRVSSTEPTRSGYTFVGWSTDPDAAAAEYLAGESIRLTGDGSFSTSVTLYAVWTAGSGSGSGAGGGSGGGDSGSRESGGGSGTSDGGSGGDDDDWWVWALVIVVIVVLIAISGYMGYRARKKD